MAELTKEKVLKLAIDFIADCNLFEANDDVDWIKASAFYNSGVADFAKAIIAEMEKGNG